jgi:hypothetical protein
MNVPAEPLVAESVTFVLGLPATGTVTAAHEVFVPLVVRKFPFWPV